MNTLIAPQRSPALPSELQHHPSSRRPSPLDRIAFAIGMTQADAAASNEKPAITNSL